MILGNHSKCEKIKEKQLKESVLIELNDFDQTLFDISLHAKTENSQKLFEVFSNS